MTDDEREAEARRLWAMRLHGVEVGGQRPWPAFLAVWEMRDGRYRLRAGASARPGQLL
jgi:hypothetical protein